MQKNPDYIQLMKLAQSPAGQQLMAMLQRSDSTQLRSAMASATAGDMEQAKSILSSLLSDPEAQNLIKQLGDQL